MVPLFIHLVEVIPEGILHGILCNFKVKAHSGGHIALVAHLQELDAAAIRQPVLLRNDGDGVGRQIPLGIQIHMPLAVRRISERFDQQGARMHLSPGQQGGDQQRQ